MSNKAKIREEARKLNPIDDVFFQVMAENKLVCQEILRTVLDEPGLVVVEAKAQRVLRNLQGRSVQLDVECILSDGRHVNIEVQKEDNDDHQRRVRYNTSCLTTNITAPRAKFRDVPDVVGVYLSRFDLFRWGHSTYHVERVVKEKGETVENGLGEVYVNAAVDDGTEAAALMRIFVEDDCYDDERFPQVSRQKRYLKESEEGVEVMTAIVQKLVDEGRMEGEKIGKRELIVSLIRQDIISLQEGARQLGISEGSMEGMLQSFQESIHGN